MRRLDCQNCHSSFPAATTFTVNGEALCEPCADQKVVAIQQNKGALNVTRGVDPTICFKCSADFGNQELPTVAGLHACESCLDLVTNFRYPTWLKTAAAVLVALLALSLVHGRSYFVAGHAYYKGRKLLDNNQPEQAVPYFESALKVGANSSEVAGYAAMAYLRSGHPDVAYEVVKDVSFEKNAFYNSLEAEFGRFHRAAAKAGEAEKLYSEAKYAEAASRMHEAAKEYPGFAPFEMQASMLDSAVAFYSGDYPAMVELNEPLWNKYPTYDSAVSLANAYACVYASTGEETAKLKAVEMMAKAKILASTKEAHNDLQEYEPRFNHRLETRKILTREQYNAQFRPEEKAVQPQ
jgi:tetratricopeptide (TPR) repeat protein